MHQFSNRGKLIAGALSILFVGVFLFVGLTYLQISELIHEEQELYIQTTLKKWDQWTDHNFAIITSLAETLSTETKKKSRDPKFQFFLSQTIKSKDLLYLAYGLEDGYYAVGGWPVPDDYDPRQRPWYQTSKSLLTPTITWPYKSPEVDSPIYISLTAPIINNGKFLGVVTGDVTMDFLVKDLFTELDYRGGSAFLINESGRILMHKEKKWTGKHLSELNSVFSSNQFFKENDYNVTRLTESNGIDYSITTLKNADSLLVLSTSQEHENKLLKHELYVFLKGVPLVLLFVLIGIFFYNKNLFLPIVDALERDKNTQLPNKNNIKKQIERRFLEKNKEGALIIISMDNYNQLNAAYPKSTVMSLQNQIKTRIQGLLNTNSLLGFFSDNNFIAYSPCETFGTGIERLKYLQTLSDSVSNVYIVDDQELHCTFSIGASCFPSDTREIEQLIDNAFSAMASARGEGTLSYSLFVPEHNHELGKAILLTNAIKKAIRKNEFQLAYQPQIDARNKQVFGVEALIRWPSSELERTVSPVEFIPVAEASDLIVEIGDYVINAAVSQISEWNKKGLKFGKVSINISPRQILKHDFLDKLLATLRIHHVDAKYIELEITETTVLGNPQRSIEVMQELQNSGFSIAMDDFGTGYSSLEYLKIMPLNKLKIDRAFIKDLDTSERDGVIVKMVVAMANALGYHVLAEGVENIKQLKYLQAHGCNLIQGYYFAKPMNALAFESFITKELVVN
jgi:diguanylate cyclase (GGDEF)-like protein